MRALVAVPAVSFGMALKSESFNSASSLFLNVAKFDPSLGVNLDVFSQIGHVPAGTWCVNVPNLPLAENEIIGIAGPGRPARELFNPPELEAELKKICGKYDKWRPYPTNKPSSYNISLAKKIVGKRSRAFTYGVRQKKSQLLIYAEHSVASLVYGSKDAAMEVFDKLIDSVRTAAACLPSMELVLFSPYGTKGHGFIASNGVRLPDIGTWQFIRAYINGRIP